MNIVLALDKRYLGPAKVLLQSLIANHSCPIDVYLLHSDIGSDRQNEFCSSAGASEKLSIHFIQVDDSLFWNVPLAFDLPHMTYYRFLAAQVLPAELDRALYLDCDIIVRRSIEEFYNRDFEGNLLIACEDIGVSVLRKYQFLSIYGRLGLELCNNKYFNAGVLLINMELARRQISMDKVFDMIEKYRNYITFSDQDILNFMYGPVTKYDDYRIFNMGAGYVTRENEAEVAQKTAILHYYGARTDKPWLDEKREQSESCTTRLWWEYARTVKEYDCGKETQNDT